MCDARSYVQSGIVYEFDARGDKINQMNCYINPGHMTALPDRCFRNQ